MLNDFNRLAGPQVCYVHAEGKTLDVALVRQP